MENINELRILAKHELNMIGTYLYKGQPISKPEIVSIDLDNGEYQLRLPLIACLEKNYGHLCIFHSGVGLFADEEFKCLKFDIGVHHYTSDEFKVICTNIDESHPGFCYISYALVSICQRQAIVDFRFQNM